jgi:hypothetical protein
MNTTEEYDQLRKLNVVKFPPNRAPARPIDFDHSQLHRQIPLHYEHVRATSQIAAEHVLLQDQTMFDIDYLFDYDHACFMEYDHEQRVTLGKARSNGMWGGMPAEMVELHVVRYEFEMAKIIAAYKEHTLKWDPFKWYHLPEYIAMIEVDKHMNYYFKCFRVCVKHKVYETPIHMPEDDEVHANQTDAEREEYRDACMRLSKKRLGVQ